MKKMKNKLVLSALIASLACVPLTSVAMRVSLTDPIDIITKAIRNLSMVVAHEIDRCSKKKSASERKWCEVQRAVRNSATIEFLRVVIHHTVRNKLFNPEWVIKELTGKLAHWQERCKIKKQKFKKAECQADKIDSRLFAIQLIKEAAEAKK